MEKKHLITIGELSKLSNLPVSRLRYYHDIGLLKANHIDEKTNYRYYLREQLYNTNFITRWRDLGFTIEEILEISREYNFENITNLYSQKESDIDRQIRELTSKKKMIVDERKVLEYLNKKADEKINSRYTFELTEIPKHHRVVLDVSTSCSIDYETFLDSKNAIFELVDRYSLSAKGTSAFTATFRDYPSKSIYNSDVTYSLPLERLPSVNHDFIKTISKEKVVKILYYGSLIDHIKFDSDIKNFSKMIEDMGYKKIGTMTFIFLINSWITSDASKHVTEIHIPVDSKVT